MNKKLLALILVGIVSTASAAVVIDNATKVEMSIKNPIPAEKTAEKELRTYLEKIFGKHTPAAANKKIILEYDAISAAFFSSRKSFRTKSPLPGTDSNAPASLSKLNALCTETVLTPNALAIVLTLSIFFPGT